MESMVAVIYKAVFAERSYAAWLHGLECTYIFYTATHDLHSISQYVCNLFVTLPISPNTVLICS